MARTATETPASYLLATQFHDLIEDIVENLEMDHAHLSVELLKYSERIVGNVGAAEAPFAVERRQSHYQMAFAAACGCASACDLILRLRLTEKEKAERAKQLLKSLAAMIRPIAEEGMEPRSESDEAILGMIFDGLDDDEPWKDEDDDEAW